MVRDEWGGNRDEGKYEGENFRSNPISLFYKKIFVTYNFERASFVTDTGMPSSFLTV